MLKVNTKIFFYVELLLSKTYFVVFKKGVKDGIIWLLRFAVKYVELEDKWNKINHGVFILEALWYLPEGSLDNVLSFLHISTVLLSKVASRKWKFKTEGSPPCERQSPTISTIERKEMFFTQENWKCVRVIQGISTSPIKRSSLQGFTLLSSIPVVKAVGCVWSLRRVLWGITHVCVSECQLALVPFSYPLRSCQSAAMFLSRI